MNPDRFGGHRTVSGPRSAIAVVFLVLFIVWPGGARGAGQRLNTKDCPPVAFVKRQHFDRPFGIGTMIGWDIYKPGGGICVYDPRRPDEGARRIFRRDDGVVFD